HPAASQKRTFHMLIKRTYHVLTTVSVNSSVVSKSRCPLLLARGVSACLWFFLPLNREGKTVVGAVGKWESRVFCGIPKRSVFSTACWPLLLVGKQAHPVRPVVHTQPSGQMLAHQHP